MKKNTLSLIPLLAMAALGIRGNAFGFSSPVAKPRTGDGKSPLPVGPTRHDLERIEAAKEKRRRRAEKRAENIRRSKANNYTP